MSAGPLRWESAGSGSPLLLIQGLGYPAAMWFRLVPMLIPHFRVITFDNRGVGRNATAPIDGLTIERMSEDAAEVIAASGEPSVTVVGVSLGGIVAQQLALAHPALIGGLVLASTHTCDEHAVAADDEVLAMFAGRSRLDPDAARRASIPFAYDSSTSAALIEEDLECRAAQPIVASAYEAQLAAAAQFGGTLRRLPQVVHRTLVLHGTNDRMVPPANARIIAGRIPTTQLCWLDGGHNLFSERPSEFAHAVTTFASAG